MVQSSPAEALKKNVCQLRVNVCERMKRRLVADKGECPNASAAVLAERAIWFVRRQSSA
jgi:hypothetical protein